MTAAESFDKIQRAAFSHQLRITQHADEQAEKRNVGIRDIENACLTMTSVALQSNGRWRTKGGMDLDDDSLDLIVVIEADVIVVTVCEFD